MDSMKADQKTKRINKQLEMRMFVVCVIAPSPKSDTGLTEVTEGGMSDGLQGALVEMASW